jgi:acetyltransferase-like isoleucine patch superfamily enzyme
VRPVIGRSALASYRGLRRASAKLGSLAISGAFAEFGDHTVIEPPFRIRGESRISIGSGVFIGWETWLMTLGEGGVAIRIGDRFRCAGRLTITSVESVEIDHSVNVGGGVYISDHRHAFEDTSVPIRDQGYAGVAPVRIGRGTWIGQNVFVGPGVTVGRGAVLGSNSVVLDDVPDHSIAVGAPARVVRRIGT